MENLKSVRQRENLLIVLHKIFVMLGIGGGVLNVLPKIFVMLGIE